MNSTILLTENGQTALNTHPAAEYGIDWTHPAAIDGRVVAYHRIRAVDFRGAGVTLLTLHAELPEPDDKDACAEVYLASLKKAKDVLAQLVTDIAMGRLVINMSEYADALALVGGGDAE